jgi:SAM-dependent methyltransferase
MEVTFTHHNVRLDDGSVTKPDERLTMENYPWFVSARRALDAVFSGNRRGVRLADLGCLEGGYAVEFARLGFDVVGFEVRDSNFAACRYVAERTNLPNLQFIQDDVWNVERYGRFDATFCCGLFYHLEAPRRFLDLLGRVTSRLLILQTHFAVADEPPAPPAGILRRALDRVSTRSERNRATIRHRLGLSAITENESLTGRWYSEFGSEEAFAERDDARWASWGNRRSFWIQKEYLIQAIRDSGFDLVAEQFDSLGPGIAHSLAMGEYRNENRGTFLGIKT